MKIVLQPIVTPHDFVSDWKYFILLINVIIIQKTKRRIFVKRKTKKHNICRIE